MFIYDKQVTLLCSIKFDVIVITNMEHSQLKILYDVTWHNLWDCQVFGVYLSTSMEQLVFDDILFSHLKGN
jgi:hypothetical protein